jgi:hypothetical protein
LSIDYDRNIRTEKIYDDHRKFTLRIIYDQVGRPFLWLPSSGLAAVNVSYFFNGRLAGLQRGAMSERTDTDKQGRILSRMFADGKVWSYSYLDKVGVHAVHQLGHLSLGLWLRQPDAPCPVVSHHLCFHSASSHPHHEGESSEGKWYS